MHKDEVQVLAVDNQSELGGGRFVMSYDAGQTAIVWDLMTGDEVARFASFDHITCAAWMKNGNVACGNSQGSIIQFEPSTSEHISTRTIDQITVTALAPLADCRTFAIGYQNGSLLIATLQPRFTILHNLSTARAPSPIVTLQWHASSPRQKSDMLAVQTHDGDLRVWSVSKNSHESAKVVRVLKKTENYLVGPNWMGWSKNGRIIQFSENETLSWDVRTKQVTFDSIPTLDHIRGLAVYGPGATLFTLGASNTVQQFDLNTPAVIVRNIQHPANILPPSPPVSIETDDQTDPTTSGITTSESDLSAPMTSSDMVSESDEDRMSPLARIVRNAEPNISDSSDPEIYRIQSPMSQMTHQSQSTLSMSSNGSRTQGRASTISRGQTENTYISAGSSMRSSRLPYSMRREIDPHKDTYSLSSLSSASMTSSARSNRHRPSRLRHEISSEADNRVSDLFMYTRSRLSDIPYKRPPGIDNSRLTNDDLRRQMLCTIFGWNREMEDLVRDEMSRHPAGSAARIMLAKWIGDIDADIMTMSSESMTSSDWMLLALSGIGGQASQHKLGRAYVQRLLEHGDVHAAATIMIGLGDHNDAIEIYVSHKRYMEALIVTCLFFPITWERQSQIIKKWGEWAVQYGHQQLAIRCFACTGKESTEPWTSPSAAQTSFREGITASIPEILSPPLSPPAMNRGPQRSIAKTSALKLITSFNDQAGKSKFFQGDGGQTPIAAGVTPIAESAIDNSDPTTALLKPSSRSALNTPSSARPRGRLPSIGEANNDLLRTAIQEVDTPDKSPQVIDDKKHTRATSMEETMSIGLSVPRAATSSPRIMREVPPSPSPQSLALLQQARGSQNSRNGPRDRIPQGLSLHLNPIDPVGRAEMTSPEQSITSSTRFHWPKRRGPGSVASSLTSASSTGRSHRQRTVGKSLDDYIHSLDAATNKHRQKSSRHNSRERRSERDSSRTRGSSTRTSSQDRGRTGSQGWTHKPKRSPTSPVPMSPEDLISLTTPKIPAHDSIENDPSTARKSASVIRQKQSSRASSRSRRRSPDRRPPMLELRGREEYREGSHARSPSSPLPLSSTAPHFQGSEDEEDYRRAVIEQEKFRNRHNRSTSSRGVKELTSPIVAKRSERSRSRTRELRISSPDHSIKKMPVSSESRRTGTAQSFRDERQLKKEAAARELEERRLSLARRPSAPYIPHPNTLSPIVAGHVNVDEFFPTVSADPISRSQSVDTSFRGMQASRDNRPAMGLPATPKAMRLKFESDLKSAPQVPPLPQSTFVMTSQSNNNSPVRKESSLKQDSSNTVTGADSAGLLPSTVYSPPSRPATLPRCMSAPIPEDQEQNNTFAGRASPRRTHTGEPMQSIDRKSVV